MEFEDLVKMEKNANKECYYFILDKDSNRYIQDNSKIENNLFFLTALPQNGLPVCCNSKFMSILFFEGEATVYIGEQKTVCFAGNVFLFRQGCDFIVESNTGAVVYLAHYKQEIFDALFFSQIADCPIIYDFLRLQDCCNEFLYFDCDHHMNISHYVRALLLELCQKDIQSEKTVRYATLLFLSNLHRIYRSNLVINESSMMKDYVIGSILKYMADHFDTASLTSTAAHFNYHPAYFSTMFQKKAHCSFTTKMKEMRLEQARRLLATTNLPVQDIIESVGFREKSYFYKCFRETYWITPCQYRKTFRQRK